MKKYLMAGILLLAASAAAAAEGVAPIAKPASADFERIKSWAGKWEGASKEEKPGYPEKIVVDYEVTSGGNVVVEKLMAGTSHEMVSTYYENPDGTVGMTHYCTLGNRPHMKLKGSDAGALDFDWTEGGGVAPTDPHMHSLKVATPDADHLTQTWSFWQDGKPQGETVIALKRVSGDR